MGITKEMAERQLIRAGKKKIGKTTKTKLTICLYYAIAVNEYYAFTKKWNKEESQRHMKTHALGQITGISAIFEGLYKEEIHYFMDDNKDLLLASKEYFDIYHNYFNNATN